VKVCIVCKIAKDADEFYPQKKSKDKLACYCKDCTKKKASKWKKDNPERNRKNSRNWDRRNPEKAREVDEKWRNKNRGRFNEITRLSKQKKPEKYRELDRQKHHKRRSVYKETDITIDWLIQLKENTKFCPLCKVELNDINKDPAQYNLDHIILLSLGGTHTKNNVRFTCRKCNLKRPKDGRDLIQITSN
jgi:hypothetical protein